VNGIHPAGERLTGRAEAVTDSDPWY